MDVIYGIDLGTTNSVVSLYDETTKQSVAVSPLIPSFVNFTTHEVGAEQKQNLINKSKDEIVSSYKVNMSMFDSGNVSRFASTLVLKEAKRYMHESNKCIISVPAYFQNSQRLATKKAAEDAGLEVCALVNEPTAAALYHSKATEDIFVVYDLGGGTFDVTVIDTSCGISDVQSTDGEKLGGDDLNRAIYSQLLLDCKVKPHHLDAGDDRAITELCERAKVQLQKTKAPVKIDLSLYNEKGAFCTDFYMLTPEIYKTLVRKVFYRTLTKLKSVVRDSGYSIDDMHLITVGGSTYDPYLQEMLSTYKVPDECTYDRDRVVSYGAAYYGYLYGKGQVNMVMSDITKGIGIQLHNDEVDFIIEANSKLPISNSVLFTNHEAADSLNFRIYQGNMNLASNNEYIGELEYKYNSPKAAHEGLLVVKMDVSVDGIVNISCREALGEVKQVELKLN